MKYQFRNGAEKRNGATADAIGSELERIRLANSDELRPEDVVGQARKKSSPLHDQFTWDDSQAADEYRKWQARLLIRDIVVISEASTAYPAFVHVSIAPEGEESRQYYQSATAMSGDERELAKHELISRIKSAERAYLDFNKIPVAKPTRKSANALKAVGVALQNAGSAAARI